MKKIDSTVLRETRYIALSVIALSAVMELIFLVIGKWDLTVLFGNLLGGGIAVLNFFLMGITIQSAVEKDEKDAKGTMKMSQSLRMLMILVLILPCVLLSCFNLWAGIIPLVFPRIAIALRMCFDKFDKSK